MKVIPIDWIKRYVALLPEIEKWQDVENYKRQGIEEMLKCFDDSCRYSEDSIPIEWLKRKYCNKGIASTEKYLVRKGYLEEIIREWMSENTV